jgi:hypothetical protein
VAFDGAAVGAGDELIVEGLADDIHEMGWRKSHTPL